MGPVLSQARKCGRKRAGTPALALPPSPSPLQSWPPPHLPYHVWYTQPATFNAAASMPSPTYEGTSTAVATPPAPAHAVWYPAPAPTAAAYPLGGGASLFLPSLPSLPASSLTPLLPLPLPSSLPLLTPPSSSPLLSLHPPPSAPPSTTPTPQLDHFIAHAIHHTCFHLCVAFAALHLLQHSLGLYAGLQDYLRRHILDPGALLARACSHSSLVSFLVPTLFLPHARLLPPLCLSLPPPSLLMPPPLSHASSISPLLPLSSHLLASPLSRLAPRASPLSCTSSL
ncbi:hypothetical protein V8E53_013331 [Lactarius tabidus]